MCVKAGKSGRQGELKNEKTTDFSNTLEQNNYGTETGYERILDMRR